MNGAEAIIATLVQAGIDTCFANPGTSEMHLVAALDRQPGIRCVLALFEGVAPGAADGYARMTGKPACTLLHLGPGLANGLANLHNARRARVPVVNLVGQHATFHLPHDTPLTSDIEAIARPFSNWVSVSQAASEAGRDAADAVAASRSAPGKVATLIVPADVAWSEGGTVAVNPAVRAAAPPAPQTIDLACNLLKSKQPTAFLLGGSALYGEGLKAAGKIAAATGAKLIAPYPFGRLERGVGRCAVERLPYILEQAAAFLSEFRQLILVEAAPPVAYFAYPGKNSVLTPPECEVLVLAKPGEDGAGALAAIEASLPPSGNAATGPDWNRPTLPTGTITLAGIAAAIGALLPEHSIVVDESMTSGRGLMAATRGAPPHDWLVNTGGSIGIALPLALGAAIACPERRVLCLTADGSGMYTPQALWSMAREGLKVTAVVFSNRIYGVLKREFAGLGLGQPGPSANNLFELDRPDLDWVALAKGMGVPGVRTASMESFARELRQSFVSDGPRLIEVEV
jgi:acetolactate synthase-1/2/3 large subunit